MHLPWRLCFCSTGRVELEATFLAGLPRCRCTKAGGLKKISILGKILSTRMIFGISEKKKSRYFFHLTGGDRVLRKGCWLYNLIVMIEIINLTESSEIVGLGHSPSVAPSAGAEHRGPPSPWRSPNATVQCPRLRSPARCH